jgi:hypothetical protein
VLTVWVLPVAVGTVVRATMAAAVGVAAVTVVLTAVLAVWLTLAKCWAVVGAGLASGLEEISRSVCVATGTCVCLLGSEVGVLAAAEEGACSLASQVLFVFVALSRVAGWDGLLDS